MEIHKSGDGQQGKNTQNSHGNAPSLGSMLGRGHSLGRICFAFGGIGANGRGVGLGIGCGIRLSIGLDNQFIPEKRRGFRRYLTSRPFLITLILFIAMLLIYLRITTGPGGRYGIRNVKRRRVNYVKRRY